MYIVWPQGPTPEKGSPFTNSCFCLLRFAALRLCEKLTFVALRLCETERSLLTDVPLVVGAGWGAEEE